MPPSAGDGTGMTGVGFTGDVGAGEGEAAPPPQAATSATIDERQDKAADCGGA